MIVGALTVGIWRPPAPHCALLSTGDRIGENGCSTRGNGDNAGGWSAVLDCTEQRRLYMRFGAATACGAGGAGGAAIWPMWSAVDGRSTLLFGAPSNASPPDSIENADSKDTENRRAIAITAGFVSRADDCVTEI